MEDAEEAFFPSAKWEIGHGGGDADVDADVSRGRLVAEFARGGAARSKEGCLVAIGAAAEKFHGVVNGISVNQTKHGAEDLSIGKLACGRQVIQDRRREKISQFVFGDFGIAPIENGFGAFANTCRDE